MNNTQRLQMELESRAAQEIYEIKMRAIREREILEIKRVNHRFEENLMEIGEESQSIVRGRNSEIERWIQISSMRGNKESNYHAITTNMEAPGRGIGTIDKNPQSEWSDEISRRLINHIAMNKKLPTFDGDVLEWPCFKRAFGQSTQTGQLTEPENLMRLYESLKGEAREAVASVMVTANSAQDEMEILQLRYGNSTIVARKIVEDLKNLPKIDTKYGDIVKFATKVKNCFSAIKAANNIGCLHSPELTREIMSKVSLSMVHLYNRFMYQENNHNEPSLILLSKFLFLEAEMACRAGTNDTFTEPVQQPVNESKPGTSRGRQIKFLQ